MSDWLDAQSLLRENNPFGSDAAPPPWDNQDPAALNVASINQTAVSRIGGLLGDVKNSPMRPFAGLVRGEAGTGKTHLLKQLLEFTRQREIGAVFCDIETLLNPAEPFRHLLRQLLNNLRQKRIPTQLKFFEKPPENLWYVLKEIVARYRNDGGRMTLTAWREYFLEYESRLNDQVLTALFRYVGWLQERDSRRAQLVLKWLGGSENAEAAAALGFPDRSKMSDEAKEAEALEIIWSLGALLRYAKMVLLIGFDRLDGMRDAAALTAFGNQILELVDKIPSVLPMLFMRSQTWSDRFSPAFDPAVRQRLESNQIILKNCDLTQAKELVERRINVQFSAQKKNVPTEIFAALWSRLQKKINFGYTPRQIIQLANALVWEDTPEESEPQAPLATVENSPRESSLAGGAFARTYQRLRAKMAENFSQTAPDHAQMFAALETFLRARYEWHDLRQDHGDQNTLAGIYRENGDVFTVKFLLNTAEHPLTVLAALRHAQNYLTENPAARLVFICDSRCDFRRKMTWRQTQTALNELKSFDRGRVTLRFLTLAQTLDYYVLAALLGKFANADISWVGATGFCAATAEDFTAWLRDDFSGDFGLQNLFAPKSADNSDSSDAAEDSQSDNSSASSPVADSETLARLVEELQRAPMWMLSAEALAGKLQIDAGDLAAMLRQETELLNLYVSRDGLLAQLRKSENEI